MGRGTNMTNSAAAPSRAMGANEALEIAKKRMAAPRFSELNIPYYTLTGSYSYGLARPDSDIDVRGFYVADLKNYLGISRFRPQEQYEQSDEDIVIYEISKFFDLAMKSNPNVMEILYTDDEISVATPLGEEIVGNHKIFLGSTVIRSAYTGFVVSQMVRMRKLDAKKNKEIFKSALHMYRLLECGTQLLTEGRMDVRIGDPDRIKELAAQPLDKIEPDIEKRIQEFRELKVKADIPEQPDFESVNDFLVDIKTRQP